MMTRPMGCLLALVSCLVLMPPARPACADPAEGPQPARRGLIRQGAYLVCTDDNGGVHIVFDSKPLLHNMGIFCGLNGFTTFRDLVDKRAERAPGAVTFTGRVRGSQVAFEQRIDIDGDRIRVRIRRTGDWPEGVWGNFQVLLPVERFGGARGRADGREFAYPLEYSPENRFPSGMTRLECRPDHPSLNVTFECADGITLGDQRRYRTPAYVVGMGLPRGERETTEFFITLPRPAETPPGRAVRWCRIGYPVAGEKAVMLEWAEGDPRPADEVRLEDGQGRVVKHGRFGPTQTSTVAQGAYAAFDFTDVRTPGDYRVVWSGGATDYFPIRTSIFEDRLYEATLDCALPFFMCHAAVDLGPAVTGHGACHVDDAVVAPHNHVGPDGFRSHSPGPAPHRPGEHVPLDLGGWHDAGDCDLNVHAQGFVVWMLSLAYEEFGIDRDAATLDVAARTFTAARPDGTPDVLQQVEWGALWLLSVQQPDGLVYGGVCAETPQRSGRVLEALTDGRPGTGDERLLYVDYHADVQLVQAMSLAAAGRVLRAVRPELAERCLAAARAAFDYFRTHEPVYRAGTGYCASEAYGREPDGTAIAAAIELYLTTGQEAYLDVVRELAPSLPELTFEWPQARRTTVGKFWYPVPSLARLHPRLADGELKQVVEATIRRAAAGQADVAARRPWPFYWYDSGEWGMAGTCAIRAFDTYWLSKVVPDLTPPSTALRGMMWLFGLHPACDTAYVIGLGLPEPRHVYSVHLHALFGYEPAAVPGIVVPGMSGFWNAGVMAHIDEYGYYRHTEACVYTQAQYIFAVAAMKAMGY